MEEERRMVRGMRGMKTGIKGKVACEMRVAARVCGVSERWRDGEGW
jgi:hypothetical protein